MLGLELGRQDVPGLKNTGVSFLASGPSRQDIADLASRRSVLGRAVLGLGFFLCPLPWIFFVSLVLASSLVSSTLPLVRSAIISSCAPNQFLILLNFCFNGDASTRFLLLEFETFMSKTYYPVTKTFSAYPNSFNAQTMPFA